MSGIYISSRRALRGGWPNPEITELAVGRWPCVLAFRWELDLMS